jgi:hypothetical protein
VTAPPKPPSNIVTYRHRPARRRRKTVAQAKVEVAIVTAKKPGKRSATETEQPPDPEADARVGAFFARMIRPRD